MHAPCHAHPFPCIPPWPCTPPCHECPHPVMHTPCHACPLTCMLPLPCMPPAMHAPLPCMPPSPCTPPFAMPTPLHYTRPPVNRMTDRRKNITLPQTSFAGGNYHETKVWKIDKIPFISETKIMQWHLHKLRETCSAYNGWRLEQTRQQHESVNAMDCNSQLVYITDDFSYPWENRQNFMYSLVNCGTIKVINSDVSLSKIKTLSNNGYKLLLNYQHQQNIQKGIMKKKYQKISQLTDLNIIREELSGYKIIQII